MAYRQTAVMNYVRAAANAILSAFTVQAPAALIPAPTVGLWKDQNFNPSIDTEIAAFAAVECDFSGYARQALTLAGPYALQSDLPGLIGDVTFTTTDVDPFVANTVYGYFIVSGGQVIAFEKFALLNIAQIGEYGAFLGLDLNLPMQPTQDALVS